MFERVAYLTTVVKHIHGRFWQPTHGIYRLQSGIESHTRVVDPPYTCVTLYGAGISLDLYWAAQICLGAPKSVVVVGRWARWLNLPRGVLWFSVTIDGSERGSRVAVFAS